MKILNFEKLAATPKRKSALKIAEAGLLAIDTKLAVKETVNLEGGILRIKDEKIDLAYIGRIFVIGIGKCSLEAGAALEEILGEKIAAGVVIDVRPGKLRKIKTYAGTHPLPTERNVDATKEIIEVLRSAKESDLVIAIVSGGGSTLLCQPQKFTCVKEAALMECLTKAGADIYKINTVRKHLSLARGGYLAKYAYPARMISLIFSDVPHDNLEFVASGPTFMDTTTVKDAEQVLDGYKVEEVCGLPKAGLVETPKDQKYFEKVSNILVVSNKNALEAMESEARSLGFSAEIVDAGFSGEARKVGKDVILNLKEKPPHTVLLYGGESTVTVKGRGKGGRNQELALAALKYLSDNQLILALASDGRDNSDYAGAVCDKITRERATELGLDSQKFLDENDSGNFFGKVGDYLITVETGSNVSDLIIAINE